MYSDKKSTKSVIGILVGVIIFIIILPFLCFWLGYFDGWLAKILIGNVLTNGLNTMFHVDYFNKDMLPLMGGTLAWIGSFFKSVSSAASRKN